MHLVSRLRSTLKRLQPALKILLRVSLALAIWIGGIPLSIYLNLDNVAVRGLYGVAWGLLFVTAVAPYFMATEARKIWRALFTLQKKEEKEEQEESQESKLDLS